MRSVERHCRLHAVRHEQERHRHAVIVDDKSPKRFRQFQRFYSVLEDHFKFLSPVNGPFGSCAHHVVVQTRNCAVDGVLYPLEGVGGIGGVGDEKLSVAKRQRIIFPVNFINSLFLDYNTVDPL